MSLVIRNSAPIRTKARPREGWPRLNILRQKMKNKEIKNESLYIDIDLLQEDPSNVRKHGQKNLDAIRGSLKKFGQRKPLVITKDNIVLAGNGTLSVMKGLGYKKVWVNRTDLEGSDAVGYSIADNRTGELAEWDTSALDKTLDSLKSEDFDLSDIGFDVPVDNDEETNVSYDDPSIPLSRELSPYSDYVMLVFKTKDEFDSFLNRYSKTPRVKSNCSASNHEAFYQFGQSRVLLYTEDLKIG